MTDPAETQTTRAIDSLAKALAPDLLAEVVARSRREAAERVERMLTDALVREMTLRAAAPAGSAGSADEDGRTVSPPELLSSEAGPETNSEATSSGWYVYGITWACVAECFEHQPGIDGAELGFVESGRVAALVSPVAADECWGSDGLGNVDMTSLGPKAQDHERVLEEVLDRGPVLPCRFGLMYPKREQVLQLMQHGGAKLEAELERLAAHREWGVTVHVDEDPAVAPVRDISEGGRSYLERRQQERKASDAMLEAAARLGQEIHERLLAVAVAGRFLPSHKGDRTPVLRGSYLVADSELPAFRTAAEVALADAGRELGVSGELTGPWPPYHFTDVRLEEIPA